VYDPDSPDADDRLFEPARRRMLKGFDEPVGNPEQPARRPGNGLVCVTRRLSCCSAPLVFRATGTDKHPGVAAGGVMPRPDVPRQRYLPFS